MDYEIVRLHPASALHTTLRFIPRTIKQCLLNVTHHVCPQKNLPTHDSMQIFVFFLLLACSAMLEHFVYRNQFKQDVQTSCVLKVFFNLLLVFSVYRKLH